MTIAPSHLRDDRTYPFDARGIAKRFRHAAIFGALDSLNPGEAMDFRNDHDPIPLLQQLEQRYGHEVGIEYLERSAAGVLIRFTRRPIQPATTP
ncbi:DUF2249 domain-containing protein [Acidiferrobacter sp.]|uniref:DUF2249 domain-containing protein n=1 Tax=Acidiferrobacter sp. TaxID=1872107 RepID=UPI00262C85B3|nr:DUF2249 domain-containing protein [Acidiferrobacter sp.]